METKRKFKFDIELIMIAIFTFLVVFVSFNLLSPVIDFIFSVFNFSMFSVIFEKAFNSRPEEQKYTVIFFVITLFTLIYIIAKIRNRRSDF